MWKLKEFLLVGVLIYGGQARAADTPVAVSFVAAAVSNISAELAVLDGGPLTQALVQASTRNLRLRLVLDPTERLTRMQGRALAQSATASLELRWARGAGRSQRRILADDKKLLRWTLAQEPLRDDLGAKVFKHRFEIRWAQALTSLPQTQILDDDLKALPDPRDHDPRIVRRKVAAGE